MKFWITISTLIVISSCVEEIAFQSENDNSILVVDAILSTSADSNFVILSRTSEINRQIFPSEQNAHITIYDDMGNTEIYHELGQGRYYLSGDKIQVETGRTYYLEITTQDGQKYQSEKETIIPVPEIDSLTFDFSIDEIIERETRVLEKSFFNLSVNGLIPMKNDQTFLKWDVEHVYQVAEITCSALIAPRICYVTRKINQNEVLILDGQDYVGGSVYHAPIAHVELDHAFGLVASFYVSQKSLTHSAYKYWERVVEVLHSGSTIFNSTPAGIPGNIRCTSGPDLEVLGYFSAIDERKKVILITRGDLMDPFYELPLCGLNGFLPTDIDFRVCCYCLNIENSTRTRPHYWP